MRPAHFTIHVSRLPHDWTQFISSRSHIVPNSVSTLPLGADASQRDPLGRTPTEIALLHNWTFPTQSTTQAESSGSLPATPSILEGDGSHVRRKYTLVISHPKCMDHHTCPPRWLQSPAMQTYIPPENVRRLDVLLNPVHGERTCHGNNSLYDIPRGDRALIPLGSGPQTSLLNPPSPYCL